MGTYKLFEVQIKREFKTVLNLQRTIRNENISTCSSRFALLNARHFENENSYVMNYKKEYFYLFLHELIQYYFFTKNNLSCAFLLDLCDLG